MRPPPADAPSSSTRRYGSTSAASTRSRTAPRSSALGCARRSSRTRSRPPFRKAEFDIQYGTGISKEGSLLDVAIDHGIVRKSGAWFIYGDDQLGQGRENAKIFLADNADIATEIELKIKEKLGLLGTDDDDDADVEAGVPAAVDLTPEPEAERG